MILKTTIRPDRFQRVISGEKKEYRLPFTHIELTEKTYEVVIFITSYNRRALVELVSIQEDRQAGDYVFRLGKVKSTYNLENGSRNNTVKQYDTIQRTRRKYVHKCEILRDGHKVGVLNLSTKQGLKKRTQLSRLQGYSFKDLPLEIITHK